MIHPDDRIAVNAEELRSRGVQALVVNDGYLALQSPTNQQSAAQISALTRQNKALIRIVLGLLGNVD